MRGNGQTDGGHSKVPVAPGNEGIKSSIRPPGANTEGDRKDRHGQPIQRGGVHHMTFLDEQNPRNALAEVKEVQAYKNPRTSCGCTIS
mmetsp:Transcript_8003/g.17300  ORF Transcript_8003/g.17300 Transcript_8003/m.17300 type:complete len:88 (-) Transcript_8003:261-524(-)